MALTRGERKGDIEDFRDKREGLEDDRLDISNQDGSW